MVIIFLFFGYSKWFSYEAPSLILLSATDHLFSGYTLFSGSGVPGGFWELRNGCFACSYFRVFGIKSWASSEPSGLRCVHRDHTVPKRSEKGLRTPDNCVVALIDRQHECFLW